MLAMNINNNDDIPPISIRVWTKYITIMRIFSCKLIFLPRFVLCDAYSIKRYLWDISNSKCAYRIEKIIIEARKIIQWVWNDKFISIRVYWYDNSHKQPRVHSKISLFWIIQHALCHQLIYLPAFIYPYYAMPWEKRATYLSQSK